MKRKPPGTNEELLARMGALFDEAFPDDPGEAAAELHAVRLDPDTVGEGIARFVDSLAAASPSNWRIRARAEREAELAKLQAWERPSGRSLEDLREAVRDLLAGVPQLQAQVNFHKFESASRDDLESLLVELEFLASSREP